MAAEMRSRKAVALLWVGGVVAATLVVLGVNGTLSSWTQAIITNPNNTAATNGAPILQETQGANTCLSSSSATNVSTCTTINKYGGTASPLSPGTSQTADVTFTNVGAVKGSTFTLTSGACTQNPTAGTGTPPANNLCTNGDLTIAVSCSPGTTYSAGSAWTDLVATATSPATFAAGAGLTHTTGLAAGASATCRFTVALGSGAGVLDQGIVVTQPLTWTLTA
ncbi:MAG: hypothetical protein QM747_19830 [Nocardioides sp.]